MRLWLGLLWEGLVGDAGEDLSEVSATQVPGTRDPRFCHSSHIIRIYLLVKCTFTLTLPRFLNIALAAAI